MSRNELIAHLRREHARGPPARAEQPPGPIPDLGYDRLEEAYGLSQNSELDEPEQQPVEAPLAGTPGPQDQATDPPQAQDAEVVLVGPAVPLPEMVGLREVARALTANKVKFLKFVDSLLSLGLTEEQLVSMNAMVQDITGVSILGSRLGSVRISCSSRKIRLKARGLLGPVLDPVRLEILDPSKKDPVAYIEPKKVFQLWLSKGEILRSLADANSRFLTAHLEARNPVHAARAAGQQWQFAEPWDGSEYFDSVQRTRHLWGPNLPQDQERQPLFVHLGVFLDEYRVKDRPSQWIIGIVLMGVTRRVSDSNAVYQPIAVFKNEGLELEFGRVFNKLGDDLRVLAAGCDFVSDREQYRVFPVVSCAIGDIPALREGLGLKIPSSCNYPCIFCTLRRHAKISDIPPGGRCRLNCGNSPEAIQKTEELYTQALAADEPDERMAIPVGAARDPRRCGLLHGLPGFSAPASVSIDIMHTEFLGETRKHAALFLRTLASVSGLAEATFCKRLSSNFRKLLSLNGISCKSAFRSFSEFERLLAFPILKFSQFFYALLRAAEIDLTDGRLEQELTAWAFRLDAVELITRHTLLSSEAQRLAMTYREVTARCCALYECFCTVKTHNLAHHLVDAIWRLGNPRSFWCFRPESLIRQIVRNYSNVNNRSVSISVLERLSLKVGIDDLVQNAQVAPRAKGLKVFTGYGQLKVGYFVTWLREGELGIGKIVKIVSNDRVKIKVSAPPTISMGALCVSAFLCRVEIVPTSELSICYICMGRRPQIWEVVSIRDPQHQQAVSHLAAQQIANPNR